MYSIIKELRPFMIGATGSIVLGLGLVGPAAAGGIIHSVHVGSPDLCTFGGARPGCDGNWSVTARQYDDGRVKGEFIDRWAEGVGVKGQVDCLVVDGRRAWISGTGYYYDNGKVAEGVFAVSAKDNGVSAVVGETPDQVSFTLIGPADVVPDCTTWHMYYVYGGYDVELQVHYLPQGQVTIK